jgi:A/G-specific adenine glycosylase
VLANILLLQLHLFLYEAVPVDGNVFRVLSRYFDVETDIAQASAKRIRFGFRSHAKDNPAIFNQAIMGLVLCNVFLKVDCSICIF